MAAPLIIGAPLIVLGLRRALRLICCMNIQYPKRSSRMKYDFRHFYQPQSSQAPRWLRRIWLWF